MLNLGMEHQLFSLMKLDTYL